MSHDNRDLPVINTVIASYWTAWQRRTQLAPLWPLLLIAGLINAWSTQLARAEAAPAFWPSVSPGVLALIISVLVAVRCHRLFLLDELPNGGRWAPAWGERDWAFLGRTIQISLVVLVLLFPSAVLIGIGGGLTEGPDNPGLGALGVLSVPPLFVILCLVSVRLSLVLPAAAIGAGADLREAWALGHGNSWRLLGVYLGMVLPVLLIDLAIEWLAGGWFASALVGAVSIAATVVGVAVLSLSFRTLSPAAGDDVEPDAAGES